MNTLDFLRRILPETGIYALMVLDGGRKWNEKCYSLEEMAQRAVALDTQGKTVYHARSSFEKDLPENTVKDVNGKVVTPGIRTAGNVQAIRSVCLDFDVDPNEPERKYATIKQAADAVVFTCKQLAIGAPVIIGSGRGLHVYWTFGQDIPVADAKPVVEAFSVALTRHGVKHDTNITARLAAVLRPVGTHWRKEGEREVTLLRDAPDVSFDQFRGQLAGFITAPSVAREDLSEWSTKPKTYPDSSAHIIIKSCSALAEMAETKGNIAEPIWHACLGLIKRCVEGTDLAHEWSSGYPGYSETETNRKLEGWSAGPPTCDYFKSIGARCDGCTQAVQTPIFLGYTGKAESAPAIEQQAPLPAQTDYSETSAKALPFFDTEEYQWDGAVLSKKLPRDGEGYQFAPFADRWFYPYRRVRLETGESAAKFCAQEARGAWRHFTIKTETLADDNALGKFLAAQEVYITGGQRGKILMREYIMDMLRGLELHEDDTRMIQSFGWHGNEGFVLGNTLISDKSATPVVLGNRIPRKFQGGFGVSGTSARWAEIVNYLFNRPGAEPYQAAILAAFAAPLVPLAESGLWHGIPVALTGDSGLGKTTTCLVASSIYGRPTDFLVSAHEMGTTLNALIQNVAMMRNLPLIMDELHGMKQAELPMLLYALSNGRPKHRLSNDGSIKDEGDQWNTVTFVTSNQNLTSLLGEHDRAKAEATQIRVFEIPLDHAALSVFADVNAKDIIENQLLGQNYGAVGHEYIQAVCQRKDAIAKAIQKLRSQIIPDSTEATKERFFSDLRATIHVAGKIAKAMGFIQFDLVALDKWLDHHIRVTLRRSREMSLASFQDQIQEMVTRLIDRTVYTKTFPVGPAKEKEHIDWRNRLPPVARYAADTNILIATQAGLKTVCREMQTPVKEMIDRLAREGALKSKGWSGASGTTGNRVYPFRGTNLINATLQTTAYAIDLNALANHVSAPDVAEKIKQNTEPSNVIDINRGNAA